MERTWYQFDKRIKKDMSLRLQIVICRSPDCRLVMHCDKKRGQQKDWCSDRCYQRERQRRIRQTAAERQRGPRKRHKGVLGTAHYSFGV